MLFIWLIMILVASVVVAACALDDDEVKEIPKALDDLVYQLEWHRIHDESVTNGDDRDVACRKANRRRGTSFGTMIFHIVEEMTAADPDLAKADVFKHIAQNKRQFGLGDYVGVGAVAAAYYRQLRREHYRQMDEDHKVGDLTPA